MSTSRTSSSILYTIVSWGVTALIVTSLLGFTFWKIQPSAPASAPEATNTPAGSNVPAGLPALDADNSTIGIVRTINLHTIIPDRPRYDVVEYIVSRGDSLFGIAKEFGVKPETVLWANYDTLEDDPHSIRLGQVLKIPAVDGIYYHWQEGDTIDAVAAEFKANPEDILTWPGNGLDLTNPQIEPDDWVMVPGGKRETQPIWIKVDITQSGAGVAGSSCSGGYVGTGGFIWPTGNNYLSGNDYFEGHRAIDIAAPEGTQVRAADSGVIIKAATGWNYGYGLVIVIDHGNGYRTLYAHLSQINVLPCQSVNQGQVIGYSGNTGNSLGAHLHFEVRLNGGFVNPWYVLPPP